MVSAAPAAILPRGWERHLAPDGRFYYFNPTTKESKWSLLNVVATKAAATKWVKKTRAVRKAPDVPTAAVAAAADTVGVRPPVLLALVLRVVE